jgi:hypothetical protein
MLRLVRVALLVVMTFLALGFVIGVGAPETGPVEKVAFGLMIVGVVLLATPVRRIGSASS